MSPLNRGSMAPRTPPAMGRPPVVPRFGRLPPPPMGMNRGMPPSINPMFHRGRPPIPPSMVGPPGPMMGRPGGPPGPPPQMYAPRRPMPPIPPLPPMGMRGPMGMRPIPGIRPGPRGMLPPHALPHMRPRFPNKNKSPKKANHKSEDLELKKPWMTDEIRIEIQKKNKLYAKAKKNKDAKEWEEFKDLRNKVTRMIRDAKNEYLAKNPDQAHLYKNDDTEEDKAENYDSCSDSEEEPLNPYCEVCDRDFHTEKMLQKHIEEHETCNIDGCKFTAHPKIVEKHISMQHSTGLYQRMKSIMSEEDVEKWRAERKRRHPCSIDNKIQLEAEKTEKEKRGEVIMRSNKKFRNQSPVRQEKSSKKRRRRRNKAYKETSEEVFEIKQEIYRGLQPFYGTSILNEVEMAQCNDSDAEERTAEDSIKREFEVSDEDEVSEKNSFIVSDEEEIIPEKIVVNKMLQKDINIFPSSGLVADYGSDSNDDEPPEEMPIKKTELEKNDTSSSIINELPQSKSRTKEKLLQQSNISQNKSNEILECKKIYADSKETAPDETEKTTKPKKHNNLKNEKLYKTNKFNNSNNIKNKKAEVSSSSVRLLNRLLERSIQHERNTIFQCITYIANNSFFD